jgi:triosephosphate isomerase
MRKRLVVGNWKMYIEKSEEARGLALALRRKLRGLSGVDVFVAPPFTMLPAISSLLESSPIRVGAQTVSAHNDGKHTGEVSALTLKSSGAQFVIVGHSERRAAGDSDAAVRGQLERAIAAGLTPILCVGEERRSHDGEHFSFIEEQLNATLKNVPKNLLKKLIVAYEPVWAIGKSAEEAMKPADLEEMTIFIRKMLAELLDREAGLKVPVLYGGSVEAENAAQLVKEGGVNGFLVGRASAHAESFLAIIEACK